MVVSVDDLRRLARRRLPRAVFDFIDGGAEDEVTLRANRRAFERVTLLPRTLVDVREVDLTTSVLGQRMAAPIVLAPTGLCGMATSRGEIAAATAATGAGLVLTVSCMSSVTLEEIAGEVPGPHWFQLYVWRDRAVTRDLVERAAAAGYRVLVVTVDAPVLGRRERDMRNGATVPPRITLANAADTLRHPRWLLTISRGPRLTFANVTAGEAGRAGLRPFALAPYVNDLFDPTVTWSDLDWLRGIWKGPLVVKGVLSGEDARLAADHGADGVVVSNHGGRQLDGAPATLDALPEVVAAAGDRLEVLLDGGVRRGSDVARALALGARACLIGRPYLYGLACGRERGVTQVLTMLTGELRRVLALMGCPSVADLGPQSVRLSPAGLS